MKSYSQLGQDIAVANYFQFQHGGYFIDVGAWDGVEISNTYMLEKELGWQGICIEPLPNKFMHLQEHRNCHCVQTAAYSANDLEFDFAVAEGFSGIAKHINRHTEALNNEKIKVKTKTLDTIMKIYNAPLFIEYLSIDTEGSEVEVLWGINWSKYTFGYITIEHNNIEPRRTYIRNYLKKMGYLFLRENGDDDDYILKR
jgi:FkbM family methyltransferase